MYLIVGLGNPEATYKWTRHNIGFEVINKLAYDHNINVTKYNQKAHIGIGTIGANKVLLAKPTTYMNLSGNSVQSLIKYYQILISKLIIVHDEIALDVSQIRIKYGGGAGGHNGVLSVINDLSTNDFLRIRVGIGQKPQKIKLSDYVLSKFLLNEHEDILQGVSQATEAIQFIINNNKDLAMNIYNQKK